MARLARGIEQVAGEADVIHCDVMDGHFVPNLTFGPPVVKAIKRVSLGIPLDVHLMIDSPLKWLDRYLDAGLDGNDYLTFHWEAEKNVHPGIERIRSAGVHPGLSIKPNTDINSVAEYLPLLDLCLVMTVEPGFGGQAFMAGMLPKVSAARGLMRREAVVAVDGGIDVGTAPLAAAAGANLLVAGNAVYGAKRPKLAIRSIRSAAEGGLASASNQFRRG